MKDNKNLKYDESTPSSEGVIDTPETVFEQLNKYGTYEIQPTADRADFFPAISQGLPTQPSGRNKKRDNTKSKLKNSEEIWKNDNLTEKN